MICLLPLIAVMLFVFATHTVLALEIATGIDAPETEFSASTQTTRVSFRRITSVDNKRFLRQETTFEEKPSVNDVHAEERSSFYRKFLYRLFGDRMDVEAKVLARDSNWLINIFRRKFLRWAGREEHPHKATTFDTTCCQVAPYDPVTSS
uniref:Secreted RxLR effector protein 47 n=1 Tax=Plasmopara viticola TaxID=143451 RepID=RLR47_PLAVT|nr:RecName: Full=Secreted RxLR effector protein 47; Flags: Precursor [Plasmopara viticola]